MVQVLCRNNLLIEVINRHFFPVERERFDVLLKSYLIIPVLPLKIFLTLLRNSAFITWPSKKI